MEAIRNYVEALFAALPQRDDVDLTLQENMIVEFYSR